MLYYFSGTGNSLLVAKRLQQLLSEALSPMTRPQETGDGAVGLVFPVYSWGLPSVVEQFIIESLPQLLQGKDGFLYVVMTCGDDVGYADRVADKLLQKHCHRRLDAAYSLFMPNTYISLPGFDVDSREVATMKITATSELLGGIADSIRKREKLVQLCRGDYPWLKTYVLRRLFKWFLLTDKYFKVDESRCIACGKCRKSCPVGNVLPDESGRPQWQKQCTGCLACYHSCPQHAIDYGRWTRNKGQKQVFTEQDSIEEVVETPHDASLR